MLINGHQLYIESHGLADAATVVLLHHGLGSVSAWNQQIPFLVEEGYQVVVYDRWGYGRSDARRELSMPFFAEDIADLHAILEKLSVSNASLIGHSDGGTIALYFAARHPEQVVSVVSVAAHVYVEPKMLSGIETVRQAYENDIRFRQGLYRLHANKADAVFYGWYNGWNRPANLNWDMRSELKHIRCSALVVQGQDDEHATQQHAGEIMAAIPRAELWLAPQARHMLPQDQPKLFNQRLSAFLQRAGQNS